MIPHALDVEKTANALSTAALGLAIDRVDEDSRAKLRILANAALVRWGVDAKSVGRKRFAEIAEHAASTMREAAAMLEGHEPAEEVIKALHRHATELEAAAAACLSMEPQNEKPPAGEAGGSSHHREKETPAEADEEAI